MLSKVHSPRRNLYGPVYIQILLYTLLSGLSIGNITVQVDFWRSWVYNYIKISIPLRVPGHGLHNLVIPFRRKADYRNENSCYRVLL